MRKVLQDAQRLEHRTREENTQGCVWTKNCNDSNNKLIFENSDIARLEVTQQEEPKRLRLSEECFLISNRTVFRRYYILRITISPMKWKTQIRILQRLLVEPWFGHFYWFWKSIRYSGLELPSQLHAIWMCHSEMGETAGIFYPLGSVYFLG